MTYTILIRATIDAENNKDAIAQAEALSVVNKDAGIIQSEAYFIQRDAYINEEDGEEVESEIVFNEIF